MFTLAVMLRHLRFIFHGFFELRLRAITPPPCRAPLFDAAYDYHTPCFDVIRYARQIRA